MNDEIEKSIAEELVGEWELKEGKLVKLFQFSSFMNAIDFVNEIAKIAERFDHHPIITVNLKTVKLSLKSFDVDTMFSFVLAARQKISTQSFSFFGMEVS